MGASPPRDTTDVRDKRSTQEHGTRHLAHDDHTQKEKTSAALRRGLGDGAHDVGVANVDDRQHRRPVHLAARRAESDVVCTHTHAWGSPGQPQERTRAREAGGLRPLVALAGWPARVPCHPVAAPRARPRASPAATAGSVCTGRGTHCQSSGEPRSSQASRSTRSRICAAAGSCSR